MEQHGYEPDRYQGNRGFCGITLDTPQGEEEA
jgi:hypothetical protein